MGERKIIAVVGATGAQGGGLVRAVLQDPAGDFTVRALTRNPESERARELASQGAEVVRADLDDVDSLVAAFQGAYGVFAVTNFWEHFSPERERVQAGNQAKAAARAGVEHVVWSTLEDTREQLGDSVPLLMGGYTVPHFDAKGESDARFRELGVPTTFLRTSFYWDNLIHFGMGPSRAEDGTLQLVLPMGDKRLAGIAAADIGGCAYGLFRAGAGVIGQTVGIAGGHLTGEEMAAAISRAVGESMRYVSIPVETYRGLGFPGAEDLGNMFQYYQDFEDYFAASRPVEGARRLNPALQDFDAWVTANAGRIPIPPPVARP